MWEEPSLADYFEHLGSFARVVVFDKRGSGISDPVPLAQPTSLDAWMDDARLAADAARLGPLVVVGDLGGGPMAMLFAATYPERVSALVLVNTFARLLRARDYPIGLPPRVAQALAEAVELHWGAGRRSSRSRLPPWPTIRASFAGGLATSGWRCHVGPRGSCTSGSRASTYGQFYPASRRRPSGSSRNEPTALTGLCTAAIWLARSRTPAYVELAGADAYPFFVNAADVLDE